MGTNPSDESNMKLYCKLRVFIASPSDIIEERERAAAVVERLNRTGAPADRANVILELIRWETHVAPLMGRPEQVILNQLAAEPWDIFVGILRSRFGSPTGKDDLQTGRSFQSGTEEEFRLAYASWRKNNRPKISFYRCMRSPSLLDAIDPTQHAKVISFFSDFRHDGKHPGLYAEYLSPEEFENKFEANLITSLDSIPGELEELRKRVYYDLSSTSIPPEAPEITNNSTQPSVPQLPDLQVGEAYDVCLISFDIVDHSKLANRYSQEKTQTLMVNFYEYVKEITIQHNGAIFSYGGDGGLLIFWKDRFVNDAILASVRLQNELKTFNLDSNKNPLNVGIEIRVAVAHGPIIYQPNISTISSTIINYVTHLQEENTSPGEVCITQAMISRCDKRARGLFEYTRRFKGESIYVYRSPECTSDLGAREIDSLVDEIRNRRIVVHELVGEIIVQPEEPYKKLSVQLDEFYSPIERFQKRLQANLNPRWSETYVKTLKRAIDSLLNDEKRAWKAVRALDDNIISDHTVEQDCDAIAIAWAAKRAQPVARLERLRKRFENWSKESKFTHTESELAAISEVISKLKELSKSDELSEEFILTDILLNYRDFIVNGIHERDAAILREIPIERLWQLADLVLQDEFFSHGHRRRFETPLVSVLADDPVCHPGFESLEKLLSSNPVRLVKIVRDDCCRLGSLDGTTKRIAELLWRCILVGHPDEDARKLAADSLMTNNEDAFIAGSVGRLIARNRIPIDSLYYLGVQIDRANDEDDRRLFFDCTRGHVQEAINVASIREKLNDIARMMILFSRFDFLIERLYFSRFEDLRNRFVERVKSLGFDLKNFGMIFEEIRQKRDLKGCPAGSLPKRLSELPLLVQRRLAGETPYLPYFCTHPDPRIALETLRNISVGNVAKVLRYPEINRKLFGEIVSRSEFLSRIQTRTVAICHPKCSPEVAKMLIATYQRSTQHLSALETISRTATRSEIREIARMRLLAQKA